MKAIVTGATGFVGSHLVEKLVENGYEVLAIVRDMNKVPQRWGNKIRTLRLNLDDCNSVGFLDSDCSDSTWFHLGWEATSGIGRSDVEIQLRNVMRTCMAVKAAEKQGCKRFIYAGSIMEYEAMDYLLSSQNNPGMGYIYSTAKLCADFMAKTISANSEIEYTTAVISNIYGPGENTVRFLNSTLKKMINNIPIALTSGEQLYDFIYISDAVKKLVFLGENARAGDRYYLGNPCPKPLKEYVLEMYRISESSSALEFGKIPYDGPFLDYSKMETDKMEKMGCFNNVPFDEGIQRTIEWMRNRK